jgi:HEAT repeat protein
VPSRSLAVACAAFALLNTAAAHSESTATDCKSLSVCIDRIGELGRLPNPYGGLTLEQQALIRSVLSFGEAAVPPLVQLLSDPDEAVADLAAAALGGAPRIDPRYLPAIRAGLDRGLGWLAPALGRMHDSEAAREAVARFLKSKSAPENQEAYAVELCGALAIPFILEAADCGDRCGARDHQLLAHALHEMGPERAFAANGLLEIARRESTSHEVAEGALWMISRLGEQGRGIESELLDLREARPELRNLIDAALIGVGSTLAGQIYAQRLRASPDYLVLRDLAETGAAGRSAGPVVTELLGHQDWKIRIAAARTLGFIGYHESADALIALLDDPADVRLHWVAVESLGRLHARSAQKRLEEVSRVHWYPPVRAAASRALAHIADRTPYARKFHPNNFPVEFFAYQAMGATLQACKQPALALRTEPADRKLYAESAPDALKALAFKTVQLSYGPPEDTKPDPETGIIEVTPQNIVEHRKELTQIPAMALRVADGWIAGSNRGEWGGELVFINDSGDQQIIADTNVEDVYLLGDRLVAVTGLAHLGINEGMLLQLSRSESGVWTSTPWRSLPGAPQSSTLVETGELLVNGVNGGSVLIADDGVMRMVPCKDG